MPTREEFKEVCDNMKPPKKRGPKRREFIELGSATIDLKDHSGYGIAYGT